MGVVLNSDKAKYRIVYRGDRYFVQKKGWFGWSDQHATGYEYISTAEYFIHRIVETKRDEQVILEYTKEGVPLS